MMTKKKMPRQGKPGDERTRSGGGSAMKMMCWMRKI
jgi:hypothetical protein